MLYSSTYIDLIKLKRRCLPGEQQELLLQPSPLLQLLRVPQLLPLLQPPRPPLLSSAHIFLRALAETGLGAGACWAGAAWAGAAGCPAACA